MALVRPAAGARRHPPKSQHVCAELWQSYMSGGTVSVPCGRSAWGVIVAPASSSASAPVPLHLPAAATRPHRGAAAPGNTALQGSAQLARLHRAAPQAHVAARHIACSSVPAAACCAAAVGSGEGRASSSSTLRAMLRCAPCYASSPCQLRSAVGRPRLNTMSIRTSLDRSATRRSQRKRALSCSPSARLSRTAAARYASMVAPAAQGTFARLSHACL